MRFVTQAVLATPLVAAYALFALGIVLIYRASRVLNLAHGAMGMFPAYVTYQFRRWGAPVIPALLLGVSAGALLGMAVEAIFVRRLRAVSSTAQTVGTVAVFGITVATVGKVWGTTPVVPPGVFPRAVFSFGASSISLGKIGLVATAVALTALLFALFKYSDLGLAMRGAADNRRAAALMGVNPDRTTRVAWMMGGGLAAIAGILLSAVSTLDPYGLSLQALPGFVAALIGGLESMPGALVGAAVVGFATGIVPALSTIPGVGGFTAQIGATQAVLAIVAFIVMAARGKRLVASDIRSEPA